MHVTGANDGKGNGRLLNSRLIAADNQQHNGDRDDRDQAFYTSGLQYQIPLIGSRAFYELTGMLVRHLSLGDRLDNPFLEHIVQTSDV